MCRGKVRFWQGTNTCIPAQTALELSSHVMTDSAVLVACLCAEWCGVCRDYRSVFEQVQARFPQARVMWVDIEDQADLVDPIDVDDFPTLLIAVGDEARFFGTITPQVETLERLIRDRTASQGGVAVAQAGVAELVVRLRRMG